MLHTTYCILILHTHTAYSYCTCILHTHILHTHTAYSLQRYGAVTWSGDGSDCSHATAFRFSMLGSPYNTCDMRSEFGGRYCTIRHTPCTHTPCTHIPCTHTPCTHIPCTHTPCTHTPCTHTPCTHIPCSGPDDPFPLLRQYQNAVFLPVMRVHELHGGKSR
jgi:hypothetical protein